MLEVRDLKYAYSEESEFRLRVPKWSCPAGSRLAIVGRSGSGKTTFLKCLAGLLQPDKGEILWKDEKVKGAKERLVPGNDTIKLVRQDFGQDPHLSVVENLRKYILSHEDEERASRIKRWLEELSLEELGNRKALQLSGGQLQRVALAQTLLAEPEVLLMDEPFSNLDPIHKHEFIPSLRVLFEKENMTTISVLHDPVDALRFADEIVVFKCGEIIESGPAEELYHHPKTLETARLFGVVNVLTEEENQDWLNGMISKPKVEGKLWFRPNEVSLSDVKGSYKIERSLPVASGQWIEIRLDQRLLIVSE